jgi:hypothetical protein
MRNIFIQALMAFCLSLSACSRQTGAPLPSRHLANADRVIVLNPGNGLTKTLTGDQLSKVVKAVEKAEPLDAEGLSASPGYTLLFFRGGVHLVTVPTAGVTFWLNGKPYQDKSGAIQSFYSNPGLGLQ